MSTIAAPNATSAALPVRKTTQPGLTSAQIERRDGGNRQGAHCQRDIATSAGRCQKQPANGWPPSPQNDQRARQHAEIAQVREYRAADRKSPLRAKICCEPDRDADALPSRRPSTTGRQRRRSLRRVFRRLLGLRANVAVRSGHLPLRARRIRGAGPLSSTIFSATPDSSRFIPPGHRRPPTRSILNNRTATCKPTHRPPPTLLPVGPADFDEPLPKSSSAYTASILFDYRLAEFDIAGSLAHARMLAACNVISAQDLADIERGMATIQDEIAAGKFEWSLDLEDVHFNIEKRLTALVGDAGKRLHTGPLAQRSGSDRRSPLHPSCLRQRGDAAGEVAAIARRAGRTTCRHHPARLHASAGRDAGDAGSSP